MFDINKASDKQKAIYANLSAPDRAMVDNDFADIDEFEAVLRKPKATSTKKPSLDSAPAKASPRPAEAVAPAKPDGFGLKDLVGLFSPEQTGAAVDAAQSVGQITTAQAGRYGREEAAGDVASAPQRIAEKVGESWLDMLLGNGYDEEGNQYGTPIDLDTGAETTAKVANAIASNAPGTKFMEQNVYAPASAAGKANQKAVADYKAKAGVGEMFQGGLRGIQLSVAENPDQLGGLAGALVQKIPTPITQAIGEGLMSVPVGRVYLSEYNNAIEAGASKQEAKARALAQAGIEYATEHVGGKFGASGSQAVSSNWAKITKAVMGETGEEMVATGAQGGLDTVGGANGNQSAAMQQFQKDQGFSSVGDAAEKTLYAGVTAAAGAGHMRAVTAPFETRAEKNQAAFLAGKATHENLAALEASNKMAPKPAAPKPVVTTPVIEAAPKLVPKVEKPTTEKAQQEDLAYEQKKVQDEKVLDAKATQLETSAKRPELQPLADKGVELAEKAKTTELVNPEVATEAELSEATKLKEEAKKRKDLADNAAFNKAEKTWKSNETKTKNRLAAEAVEKDLDPSHIALGMREWAKNNPRPERATSKAAPVVEKTAPVAKAPKVAEAPKASVADRLKQAAATPSKTPSANISAEQTPARVANVKELTETYKQQFKSMAPKDINAVVDAVTKGHLVVARTGATMANGKTLPNDSKGHYDGKTMYVNEAQLKKGANLKDVANHEVEHFFRMATAKDHENIKGLFAGKENLTTDNAAIEKLAAGKNKIAQQAVASAKAAAARNPSNPDAYALELPAYFVEHSSEAVRKGGVLGSARQSYNDIKSSLKENILKKVVPLTENPDYVSRKRLENTDKTVQPKSGQDMASYGGPTGKGFSEAKANKLTFRAQDGKERYYIPDEKSTINKEAMDKIMVGDRVPITQIYDNPELFKAYPQLKATTFSFDPMDDGGSFDGETLHISMAKKGRDSRAKVGSLIAHEMQHAIQAIEGFANGSNPEAHYDHEQALTIADDIREKMLSPRVMDNVLDSVAKVYGYTDLDDMALNKEMWTPENRKAFGYAKGLERQIDKMAEAPWETTSADMTIMGDYILALNKLDVLDPTIVPEIAADLKKLDALDKQSIADYYRTHGEREAYLTQKRHDQALSDHQLDNAELDFYTDVDGTETSPTIMTPEARLGEVAQRRISQMENPDLQSFGGETVPGTERGIALQRIGSIVDGIANLVTTTSGLGKTFRELRERAESWPTEYQLVAEAAAADLRKERTAAETVDPNFDGQALINRIESTKDAAERERILNSAGRDHPEFARSYREFRDAIDQFTDLIIQERAKMLDTHPLSEKEEAIYEKMLDNKGQYTTRAYLLGFGKRGDLYGERTWAGYKRAEKLGDKATESERASYTRVAHAIQYFRGELVIPEVLPESKTRLKDLYAAWFTPREGDTVASMTEKLEALRPTLDQEQIDNMAERIIRQILGVDAKVAGSIADRIRGESRDNTIVTARNQVPLVLRNLMGEVKDSPMKMMLTLSAQAQFLARTRMLAEVSQNKEWVIPSEQKALTGNEKYSVPLQGAQWGPLEGMYATPKVAELLRETVVPDAKWKHVLQLAATDTSEASKLLGSLLFSAWGKAANVTKGLTVVGNPFNYIWNVGGNFANLSRAGNFNPKYIAQAAKVALELVNSKSLTSVSNDTRAVLRAGVSDSGQIGELTADKMSLLEDMIYQSTSKTTGDKVKGAINSAATTAKEVYAMTDVVSKIANYLYYKEQLSEFYKLEGIDKTEDTIEREAADRVSDDNITFKRAMPLAKMLESRGITMFAPYIAEVFRTQYNNLVMGFQELNRARNAKTTEGQIKMAEIGLRRLAGTTIAYAVLVGALASMAGAGDDDKDKAVKKFLPDYAQYGAPFQVGEDEHGNPLYVTLNRADPWGPLTDIARALRTGNIEDMQDAGNAVLDLYVKPRLGYTVAKVLETQFSGDATSYDKRAAAAKLGKMALPAWFVNADTPNSMTGLGASGYPQGGDRAALGDAFKVLGGRLEVADVKKTLGFAAKDFQSVQKTGRKELYQTLSRETDMTTDDFVSALQSAHEAEAKQFRNLVELDKALVTMGKRPQDRRTYWKAAGLNTTVTELVMKGKNPATFTTLLNRDSINKSWGYEAARIPEEESAKAKANIATNAAKLKKLGYTFN